MVSRKNYLVYGGTINDRSLHDSVNTGDKPARRNNHY